MDNEAQVREHPFFSGGAHTVPPTNAELNRARAASEANKPSFGTAMKEAYALETVWGLAASNLDSFEAKLDPAYQMTEESYSKLTDGIPREFHDHFLDAVSDEHAWAIRGRLEESLKSEQVLNDYGWGGILPRTLAAVTDPIAWAAMVGSEGVLAPWVFASKASRLSKAVRGAIVAGGSNAALETYLYSQSYTKQPQDILWAGVLGGALGGAITPFVRGPSTTFRELQKQETRDLADQVNASKKESSPVQEEDLPDTAGEAAAVPTGAVTPEFDPGTTDAHVQQRNLWDRFTETRGAFVRASDNLKDVQSRADKAMDDMLTTRDMVYGPTQALEILNEARAKGWTEEQALPKEFLEVLQEELDEGTFSALMTRGGDDAEISDLIAGVEELKDELIGKAQKLEKDFNNLSLRAKKQLEHVRRVKAQEDRLNDRLNGLFEDVPADALPRRLTPEEQLARSVGAAQVDDLGHDWGSMTLDEAREYIDDIARDDSLIGKARFDIVGRLLKSVNPFTRHGGFNMAENAVGMADHTASKGTASEFAHMLMTRTQAKVYGVMTPAFKQWVRKQGHGRMKAYNRKLRSQFMQEVSEAIRSQQALSAADEEVRKVAQEMQKAYEAFLLLAKEHKVKGFEKVNPDSTYLPRFIDMVGYNQLRAMHADSHLENLLRESLLSATPEMDTFTKGATPYSLVIARAYLKRIGNHLYGVQSDFSRSFSSDNMEMVREVLLESDVDEATIADIQFAIKAMNKTKQTDAGNTSRARHRVRFDETFKMQLPVRREHGGGTEEVSMSRFFENDAESIFSIYSRQMSGHIALARFGWKSKADWNRYLQNVRTYAQEHSLDARETEKEVELLQFLYDAITGSPLERDPASWVAKTTRFVRDWNFVTMMGQVGFAQVAEFGNMLGQVGLVAAFKHIRPFGKAIRRMADTGEVDDQFLRDLESIGGFGTDRLRHQVMTRFDDYDHDVKAGGLYDSINHGSQVAKRVIADLSFMAPINVWLQRTTAKVVTQRLTDMAYGAKGISDRRLATLGIDATWKPRIDKLLREQVDLVKGTVDTSRTIRALNPEKMRQADPEAAEVLFFAINRWTRKIIQENDVGATHEWMHSTLGKTLFQFRSFMLTAWGKQTLHNLHARDFQSGAAFMWSMVFGGLAYATQQTLNSVGREDQKEFLEERLSMRHFAPAVFQRSGMSSLIPAAIDTGWTHAVSDYPIFAYGRSTGLASDAFLGIPSVNTASKLSSAVGTLKNLSDDRVFSQQQHRAITGMLPGNNVTAVRNLLSVFGEDLPVRSQLYREER